jgi:hypothetical protein
MCYFERVLIALSRLITAGLIALVLSLGVAAPIAAQTEYVGLRRQEANQGNAGAQLTLGFMYANSFDVRGRRPVLRSSENPEHPAFRLGGTKEGAAQYRNYKPDTLAARIDHGVG